MWPKLLVCCLVGIVTFFLCEQADARKKRKRFVSPVRVEEVATYPNPFIIGQSPMTLSMMVKVPLSKVETKILEVSALITSPTRKSMSFVTQRLPLAEVTQGGLLNLVSVDLVWDGKDQYDRLVADGSYFYEIQAKILDDKGNGPRTKIVSHRVQGTLEALAYVGEVLPPLPPEPEVPAEIEALQQKELDEQELPLTQVEEKIEKNTSKTGDDPVGDEEGLVLEGSSGGDSTEEIVKETMEDLVPEIPGEGLLKEADTAAPATNEPEAVVPLGDQTAEPITESSVDPVPTELSLPSEETSAQH